MIFWNNLYIYSQECECKMKCNYVKKGWDFIKKSLGTITEFYSKEDLKSILELDGYYLKFLGRAGNRRLIKENPKLYVSIYKHTDELEMKFKKQKSYYGFYNLKYRLFFIVKNNYNIESLKCQCGEKYVWNMYCRKCPEYHKTWLGRKHTKNTKLKQRLSTIKYIENVNGQISPRYNTKSIKLIEEYGKKNGYNFQHAENGGEYYIKELGYWLDGYDKDKNVAIEIDERHHYKNKSLSKKDINRQSEIEDFLGCKFIRLKYGV